MSPKIIKWEPTGEMRFRSPDERYAPQRLERLFFCTADDGVTGYVWCEVNPAASLSPLPVEC
jgi:hypothetical protein